MTENQRLALLIETLKKEGQIYNRQDFIDKVKADKTYISRILNGKLTLTSKYCDRICSAYPQVNKDWLLYGKGDMFKSIDSALEDDSAIKNIRKIIKYIIFKEDCTQEEIADNLGVNKTYLSEVINGRYPVSKRLQDKIVLKYPYVLSDINPEKISAKTTTPNHLENDKINSDIDFYKKQISDLTAIVNNLQNTITTLISSTKNQKKTDSFVTPDDVLYSQLQDLALQEK